MFRARLATIGTYGVGKTSVIHNLLGQPFVEQHRSTEGIHTQKAQIDKLLDVKEASEWTQMRKGSIELNEDDLQREVLLYLIKNQNYNEYHNDVNATAISHETEERANSPKSTENLGKREMPDNTPNPDEELLYKIGDAFQNCDTEAQRFRGQEQTFRISIWDFGGQIEFYATHHMFLDPKLVYMLVLDITKNLDSVVKTHFLERFGSREVGVPKTVREFIDYWLNTIHWSSKNRSQGNRECSVKMLPPVVIVLTHEDMIPDKDKQTYITKFKNEFLRHVDGKVYEPHLFLEKIFVIDNKTRDWKKTQELKSTILKLASEQPGWGDLRPLNWLRLENEIYQESRDIEKPFIDIGRVIQLANTFDIDDDNLGNFLSDHHALGDMLYFKDTDKVVTDPQWLIYSFSKIITAPEFFCRSMNERENLQNHVRKLEKEGVASIELLGHKWKDDANFLLHLMIQFSLMIPIEEQYSSFYIPCLLPAVDLSAFDSKNNSKFKKVAPAVVYRPSGDFLPLGLFQKLICQFKNLHSWKVHGKVWYNAVVFRVKSLHEVLVSMTSRAYGVQFQILSPTQDNRFYNLSLLRTIFEDVLSKVTESAQYTLNFCPCEESVDPDLCCLVPVEEVLKDHSCAICPAHSNVIKPEEYQIWFKNTPTDASLPHEPNNEGATDGCQDDEGLKDGSQDDSATIIRAFSKKITDESVMYDVGFALGLNDNDIAGIRTDNPKRIQEAGYHMLRYWLQFIRDQSSKEAISQTLNHAFQEMSSSKFSLNKNSSDVADDTSDTSKTFVSSSTITDEKQSQVQDQSDLVFIRKLSKLITDQGKVTQVGLNLGFNTTEISAVLTDHPESIELAGFHVLRKWYVREQIHGDHLRCVLRDNLLDCDLQRDVLLDLTQD